VTTLTTVLNAAPVVLDGGLATQLETQGHDLSSALWSARLLLDDPGAIRDAHLAFLAAGAQVTISASYQASFAGFARLGLDRDEAVELMVRSVTIAREAADSVADDAGPRWVAASLGPYGAALADGSEYTGAYDLDTVGLRAWHRPRLEVLAASGADVIAIETIPCLAEVEAVLEELSGTGASAWLSLTCAGGRTRAGEPVADAFEMAADVSEVFAVGVNCTEAVEVTDLVATAAAVGGGKPVVIYPNSGERWDARQRAWKGQASYTPELVDDWIAAGARLVGGCCRVGPNQIAEVATRVRSYADPG
jgi:homocysteine S-methyltransferase